MDLFNIFKDFVKETVQFKSFKKLNIVLRIPCFIVLLPFIALYSAMLIAYLVIATIYKVLHSIFDYLYIFVHREGKIVKHATQAIIYLIGFPLLFALKVLYGVIAFPLFIFHFIVSPVGYIATFGGIKYSPFMYEPVDRFGSKEFPKHCIAAVIVFVVLGLVLLSAIFWFQPVATNAYANYKTEVVRSEILDRMQSALDNGDITSKEWNSFVAHYNAEKVNGTTYHEYVEEYLGQVDDPIWNAQEEAQCLMLIALIGMLLPAVYVLFTILYVAIYSNAIKSRALKKADSSEELLEEATK